MNTFKSQKSARVYVLEKYQIKTLRTAHINLNLWLEAHLDLILNSGYKFIKIFNNTNSCIELLFWILLNCFCSFLVSIVKLGEWRLHSTLLLTDCDTTLFNRIKKIAQFDLVSHRDYRQIWFLILREFKRINHFLSTLKSSKNLRISDDSRGNKS